MANGSTSEDYLGLAAHWFAKANKLPDGEMRDRYFRIAAGYEKLAGVLEALERHPITWLPQKAIPAQEPPST
jgi:hypothetical protein